MIRIGIVGIGFMGMIHYLAVQRIRGAKVTAIATRDPKKQKGDWSGIQGNFGPPGKKEDLKGVRVHSTLEELLDDDEVDLVDICLPNDQHARATLAALSAAKHVMVEKAIALTLKDADRMVAAATRAKRQLLVAHVLPFFADFGKALELTRSGKWGALRAAHLRRHISPPDWSADFADSAKSGGPVIDLHIHDAHFVRVLAGMPTAVHSVGVMGPDHPVYVSTNYLLPDGVAVSATSGSISHPTRPFTHGFELFFEKATAMYEAGGPLRLFAGKNAEVLGLPSLDPVDCFAAEISRAVQSVRTDRPDPILNGELARDALALCLKEIQSLRTGRVVKV